MHIDTGMAWAWGGHRLWHEMGIGTGMGMMHGSGEDTDTGMAWELGEEHGPEGDLGMERGWTGLWGEGGPDVGMDRYMRWIKCVDIRMRR